MTENKNILIVDDDKIILDSLCEFLSLEGYDATGTETLEAAATQLKRRNYSLVITDVNLPDGDGMELLDTITRHHPQTVSIAITGYGSIESAVTAIKRGAYDYLTKPIVDDELRLTVERAIKQQALMSENESLRLQLEQKYSLENVISQNYKMAKVFDLIESVADTNTTILMTGPSGTGKSMLSRVIHNRSSRRNRPFVEVSCGALPETLLESELFGHAKGAFTGAVSNKKGKFLAADKGTIFLDEISNASPALQVKLLRVLQDKQFEPVGSNETITVDTRIILATNKDIVQEVKQGRFREDLYYRINVVTVKLSPLRERIGDIPLLANHFLRIHSAQHKKDKIGITDDAMRHMEQYSWPGNIRELQNIIERAVLLSKDKYITPQDLPDIVQDSVVASQPYRPMSLKEAMAEPEKNFIRQALNSNGWNRQATAQVLGINRTTLFKKMKQYGLYKEAQRLGLA